MVMRARRRSKDSNQRLSSTNERHVQTIIA
jgi:hypothetical protein